jgi:hypothetical protein
MRVKPPIDFDARIIVQAEALTNKNKRISRKNQFLNEMVRLVSDNSMAELAQACEIKALNDQYTSVDQARDEYHIRDEVQIFQTT